MFEINALRCEYEQTPLSVAARRPRFSWQIASDRTNVVQEAYRLEIALDAEFARVWWDSGWVEGADSHLVEYAGPELEAGVRYHSRVHVRATGQKGVSPTSWFETTPLEGTWEAPFIGMERPEGPASSRPIYLRREFELAAGVHAARVYATALGIYELTINGTRVGEDCLAPGWTNYDKRLAFQSYDVTEFLRPGANAIGAIVGAGWYKGNLGWFKGRNYYGEQEALSLDLRVTLENGSSTRVISDPAWHAAEGAILYSELYHGEHQDARLDARGWNRPGFDEAGWQGAVVVDFDANRVVPQEAPPVRRQERLPVREVIHTPRGETVLDFGQNLTGWVALSVEGKEGDRVVLRHAEVLDAEGNFYTENLRSARAQDEYTLAGGGTERFEPHFTFHGFRYVHVVEYPGGSAGGVDPSRFTAVVVHSQMEPTLEFECSNPLLNQLHHNILWGWKGNAVDIPTDCPQRDERLGWTGDAEVFVGTATYLTQSANFFRKWLRDLASEQREDGGVPFVVPDLIGRFPATDELFTDTHSSTGWGDAAVICPWTLYERFGDRQVLREQYASMKAWIEHIRAHAEGGLIWKSGFHFGDWVALDAKEGSYFGATPNDLTATAFYAYSTDLLARTADLLGEERDAADYATLHRSIVEAFRAEFITPNGRVAARTQTAQILALVFGLVPEGRRERVVADLVQLIEENDGHLTTGFLGTPFLCRALAENGRLDAAYRLLLREEYPSWLYQVTQGATTVWEHWDGMKPDGTMWSANMNSFNHYAYGAIGEWIYSTLGGIAPDPEDPGFHTVILAPRPGGGITHARTGYEGPYGHIELTWRIKEGRLVIDAVVPPNSLGRFRLVGVAAAGVTAPDGVAFQDEDGSATAEVGSGRWHLECPWEASGN